MIFCVEDEQNICELEVYTLQSVGMEAQGCGSGRELFALLEKQVPELIVLDIMLPDEDGVSILRRLRADKRYANIPVIMATAKGSEFDKVKGLDSGADDYIAKPFGMLEMVAPSRLCCAAAQHHAPVRMRKKSSASVGWRSTKWSIR